MVCSYKNRIETLHGESTLLRVKANALLLDFNNIKEVNPYTLKNIKKY